MKNDMRILPLIALATAIFTSSNVLAQGCVAAHSNQRTMDQLVKSDAGFGGGGFSLHNLTVDIGYRVFNSNKDYIGTRNQLYPPTGVFQVSGLGDVTIGAQSWIFRPPTENGGNIAVSASLK